jgi:arylsulfatase
LLFLESITSDILLTFSTILSNGKFVVAHNTGTIIRHLESKSDVPVGKSKLKFELNYIAPEKGNRDRNAPAGTEAIYINDVKVAERPITALEGKIAVYKDGIDVGSDRNSPVSDRYKVPFSFAGKLNNVTIEYK